MRKYRRKMESFTLKLKKTLKIFFLRNLMNSLKNLKKKYKSSDVSDMINKLLKFEMKNSEKIYKIKNLFKATMALFDIIFKEESGFSIPGKYTKFLSEDRKFFLYMESKFSFFQKIQIIEKERKYLIMRNEKMLKKIAEMLKAKALESDVKRIIRTLKKKQTVFFAALISYTEKLPDFAIPHADLLAILKDITLVKNMHIDLDDVFGKMLINEKVQESTEKEFVQYKEEINVEIKQLDLSVNTVKDIGQQSKEIILKFKEIFKEVSVEASGNNNNLESLLEKKREILKDLYEKAKKSSDEKLHAFLKMFQSMMASFTKIEATQYSTGMIMNNEPKKDKGRIKAKQTLESLFLSIKNLQFLELRKISLAIESGSEEEDVLKGITDEEKKKMIIKILKRLKKMKEECSCNIYSIVMELETKKTVETLEVKENVKVVTEMIEIIKTTEPKEKLKKKNSILEDSMKLLQMLLDYLSNSNNSQAKKALLNLRVTYSQLKEHVKADINLPIELKAKEKRNLKVIDYVLTKMDKPNEKDKNKKILLKCGFGILRPEVREKSPVIEETEDLIQSILQYIDERVGTETKSVKTFDEIKSLFKKLLQEFEEDDDSLPDKTKVIIEENINKIRIILNFVKQKEEEINEDMPIFIFEKQVEHTKEIIENDELGEAAKMNLNKIMEAQLLLKDIISRGLNSFTDKNIEEIKKLTALIKNAINWFKDKDDINSDVIDMLQKVLENMETSTEKIVDEYKKEKYEGIDLMIESLTPQKDEVENPLVKVKLQFSTLMQVVMKIEDLGIEALNSKEKKGTKEMIRKLEETLKALLENKDVSEEKKQLVMKIRKQVDYIIIIIRKYFHSIEVSTRMDEIEDLLNDSNDGDEDDETASLVDKFVEDHRKYEELMKKAYIEGVQSLIEAERERLNKLRDKMKRHFDKLFARKVFNVKLKEKFLELQLKINEDEGVMREESREQKFNDMETLLEGLFEDVKSKLKDEDSKDEDSATLESLWASYVKISTIQVKIKKEKLDALTEDEVQTLEENEKLLKYHLKLLKNSKNTNGALKQKLLELEKFLKQKNNILKNKAQADGMEKNNKQLNDVVTELEKIKDLDDTIKKLLKKLRKAQIELAQLLNIVLEEGMESLEKRELEKLEALKKEIADATETLQDDARVTIAVKIKLTKIQKYNEDSVKLVETMSVQKSSEEIYITLQFISDIDDLDSKFKVKLNCIKDKENILI